MLDCTGQARDGGPPEPGGMAMPSRCLEDVLRSCERVCSQAESVTISEEGLEQATASFSEDWIDGVASVAAFDSEIHLVGRGPLTAQYLLVLDALNFCFWPEEGLAYVHLACGLKAAVERDPDCISAAALAAVDEPGIERLVGRSLPLLPERARLLREVGEVLQRSFAGQASCLIERAGGSAQELVSLVTCHFRGFQDHAVYRGQQVFLYKRAQIFVGDVWGAFRGEGLGCFHDIHQLTMFADYRVPVVLRHLGILRYSQRLAEKLEARQELPAGGAEEVELRAASIVAVERLRARLAARFARPLHAVQLDWWLWETGEREQGRHRPHHRTLTIFY